MTDRQRLLELALKGLEADRAKIDTEILEIRSQLNHRPTTAGGGVLRATPAKKKTMSAEARRNISEAMKRRYAAMREGSPQQGQQSRGGGLTAAGRKKLSEIMKARWAAKKKAAKK